MALNLPGGERLNLGLMRGSALHRGGHEEFEPWPDFSPNIAYPCPEAHEELDNASFDYEDVLAFIRAAIRRIDKYRRVYGDQAVIRVKRVKAMHEEFRMAKRGRAWSLRELLGWLEKYQYEIMDTIWLKAPPVPEGERAVSKYFCRSSAYADLHIASFVLDKLIDEEDNRRQAD